MTSASLAKRIRLHSLRMTHLSGSSHIGSCLSCADILAVLYNGVMRVRPEEPDWEDRDRFILSKGHAASALYAVLAERGYFPIERLNKFCQEVSMPGHAIHCVPGVDFSTGSLGHGLSVGAGMALSAKRDGKDWRVFVLLSDGDMNEGSTWEAILFSGEYHLDNLIAIVDYNRLQALGDIEAINLAPFSGKWNMFGWKVRQNSYGHDIGWLEWTLSKIPFLEGYPSCTIPWTTKGKGVSFMEDNLLWHYHSPQGEEYEAALRELEG